MAKQRGNVVTHGLRGKIGDLLVFRQRAGETVISKMPEPSKTVSEKQKKQRKHFQKAVFYAKAVFEGDDMQTIELYEEAAKKKKGLSAYNVAVADFCHAPDIESVDLTDYFGVQGDKIRITASDDFAVKSVHVRISNADGTIVEEGYATQNIGNQWTYVASQNNGSLEGDKIEVSVSDLPGNITVEELNL
jgi:hypothetical protein